MNTCGDLRLILILRHMVQLAERYNLSLILKISASVADGSALSTVTENVWLNNLLGLWYRINIIEIVYYFPWNWKFLLNSYNAISIAQIGRNQSNFTIVNSKRNYTKLIELSDWIQHFSGVFSLLYASCRNWTHFSNKLSFQRI